VLGSLGKKMASSLMVKVPIFNLTLWIQIIYASYGLTLMFSLSLQVCWTSSSSLNRPG